MLGQVECSTSYQDCVPAVCVVSCDLCPTPYSGVLFSGGGLNHTMSGVLTSVISLGLLGKLLGETRKNNEVGGVATSREGRGYTT